MNKFLSLLGLARRAGKICMGSDVSVESILNDTAKLLILAGDISSKSSSKPETAAASKKINILKTPYSMDEFERYLGKRTGIITVSDKGFSDKLTDIYEKQTDGNKGDYTI